jgi:two-component system phosphate regulon response regulator PhoB
MTERRRRILVVEDDPAIRALEERILLNAGFDVQSAEDGVQGLARSTEGPWDLFLLDVMMPGMNGLELARRLRAAEATAHTPILFATVRNEPEIIREAFAAGASLFLVKPFSTTTLLALVRAAVTPA